MRQRITTQELVRRFEKVAEWEAPDGRIFRPGDTIYFLEGVEGRTTDTGGEPDASAFRFVAFTRNPRDGVTWVDCAGPHGHARSFGVERWRDRQVPFRAPSLPGVRRSTVAIVPVDCNCGCGGQTKGGRFLPGHDARLKGQLKKIVGGKVKATKAERQAARDRMIDLGWSRFIDAA